MKMRILFWVTALLLVLSLTACSSGDDDGLEAPDVGTPETLQTSGAAAAPADSTEAITIFSGAMEGFSNVLSAKTDTSRRKGRAIETYSEPINWSDDTATVTGSITGTAKYPDDDWVPEPGNDIVSIVMNMTIDGTITGATFTDDAGDKYTVSGTIKEQFIFDYNVDYLSTGSYNIDYSFEVAFGAALAIKRLSDNVGAKFIISFADGFSEKDKTPSDDEEDFIDTSFLENAQATLTVYDDANVKVLETTISLSDIESLDPSI